MVAGEHASDGGRQALVARNDQTACAGIQGRHGDQEREGKDSLGHREDVDQRLKCARYCPQTAPKAICEHQGRS